MADDLKARLMERDYAYIGQPVPLGKYINRDGPEALDAIERLERALDAALMAAGSMEADYREARRRSVSDIPSVHEYVKEYQFDDPDGGTFDPGEEGRVLLEDGIEGYLCVLQEQTGLPLAPAQANLRKAISDLIACGQAPDLVLLKAERDGLASQLLSVQQDCIRLRRENDALRAALEFYADPATYFAIGFFPDPPCGDFMEDFSETEFDLKPGKLARETLDALQPPDRVEPGQQQDEAEEADGQPGGGDAYGQSCHNGEKT